MIFSPRLCLHSRRNIYSVGAHFANRFAHVFGGQSARENDGLIGKAVFGFYGEVPVKGFPCPAKFVLMVSIEEDCGRLAARLGDFVQAGSVFDAIGSDAPTVAVTGPVLAQIHVILKGIKAFGNNTEKVQVDVVHHGSFGNKRRNPFSDLIGGFGGDKARCAGNKNKPQCVRTEFNGFAGVFEIRDAADFNSCSHGDRIT